MDVVSVTLSSQLSHHRQSLLYTLGILSVHIYTHKDTPPSSLLHVNLEYYPIMSLFMTNVTFYDTSGSFRVYPQQYLQRSRGVVSKSTPFTAERSELGMSSECYLPKNPSQKKRNRKMHTIVSTTSSIYAPVVRIDWCLLFSVMALQYVSRNSSFCPPVSQSTCLSK